MRRVKRALGLFAFVLCAGSVAAQTAKQNALPTFDYETATKHEIKPHREAIPLSGVKPDMFHQFQLTLTVSPSGDVIDTKIVHAASEDMQFWPQVEGEVRGWKFTPFEKDGTPVKAEVEEWLDVTAPERVPETHVTPPTVRVGSRIVIVLNRTGCFGSCPDYTVTVTNNRVVFEGRHFVTETGTQNGKADPEAVRKLAEKFVAAGFYSMDPEYRANWTDNPTYTLSITIDGRRKTVTDYIGWIVGMPAVITELEHDVDSLAQTDQWIRGNQPGSGDDNKTSK
jgi:hypothetical protein